MVVDEPGFGRALLLRDVEGIAPGSMLVPLRLAPVVAAFDGRRTTGEIARDLAARSEGAFDEAVVERLADELDAAYLLESPRFQARRRAAIARFAAAPVRRPAHAGSAYHAEPAALARFIEEHCLARAPDPPGANGPLVGLCAPHMDLWRAAAGYGHAYRALARALPAGADTFVLLGTSHAAMRRPFAVCEKAFETPLGALEPDRKAIGELAESARFDVRADEYLHKQEHSLEFQVVFLRHALGDRPARIVPILCGLGEAQARRRDPALDPEAESFIAALASLVARQSGRVVVVAGADLAHVGPRFGDPAPPDEAARDAIRGRDMDSIGRAVERDAAGFFEHVSEDLETRRVCGLAPIYTMLRVLPSGARGEVLHYAQCVDPNEGSVVTHASLGFYQT